MVELNRRVRLVAVQFSFSNSNMIPVSVKHLEKENTEERTKRKGYSRGVRVIEPTMKCSLEGFVEDLKKAGYEMVDAFYKERINPKCRKTYHMIHFLFARREFVDISDEFIKAREGIYSELHSICKSTMWRVRAFSNPLYEKGKEVHGQHSVSINTEVREPLFYPDGHLIEVWQKDAKGNRVGDVKVPLVPENRLSVVENIVTLVMALIEVVWGRYALCTDLFLSVLPYFYI